METADKALAGHGHPTPEAAFEEPTPSSGREAVRGPGDDGYLAWLNDRARFLTDSELRRRRHLHHSLVRFVRSVATEEETLNDLFAVLGAREVGGSFVLIEGDPQQLTLALDDATTTRGGG